MFLVPPGRKISATEIANHRAQQVLTVVPQEDFVRLVECYSNVEKGSETLVIDVDVEVSQKRANPIRSVERIGIEFSRDDSLPEIYALRKDFPTVPHLNLRVSATPKSLCLFEESWEELRLNLTAPRLLRQLRIWLAKTARGELHSPDQPLEPLLGGEAGAIEVPYSLLKSQPEWSPIYLKVATGQMLGGRPFFVAGHILGISNQKNWLGAFVEGEPQPHGIIKHAPQDAAQLHGFLLEANIDFIGGIRACLREWFDASDGEALSSWIETPLVVFVKLPKARGTEAARESYDLMAFRFAEKLGTVGEKLGIWQVYRQDKNAPRIALLIGSGAIAASSLRVETLNCMLSLDPLLAQLLHGKAEINQHSKMVAVGAGALGSHLVLALAKQGFSGWTIVDKDSVFPHNLTRFALPGLQIVGLPKARVVADAVAATLINSPGEPTATGLTVDVLKPGDQKAALDSAFSGADLIFDFSASIPVSRLLSRDVSGPGRRIAAFLNPIGTHSVLLQEDSKRQIPLDAIEFQYYRALVLDDRLSGHLSSPDDGIRYARGCRDITSTIRSEQVLFHSAVLAANIGHGMSENASARVFVSDAKNSALQIVDIPLAGVAAVSVRDWKVIYDEGLITILDGIRREKLPAETGGILLGNFDVYRKVIYASFALPAPSDSKERPYFFVRGNEGLAEAVKAIDEKTLGNLTYIGEWHSHPPGSTTTASDDDLRQLGWLHERMRLDGLPALICIVGENKGTNWLLA